MGFRTGKAEEDKIYHNITVPRLCFGFRSDMAWHARREFLGGDPAEGMPPEAAEVYRRVAGVVIETVRDEREREAKLRGEGA